jgi:arginyl-tRNA synthetase
MLTHPKEKALILKLQDLGHEVERCAEDYGVNRLATYAVELARTYHHFYDACRVIQPEEPGLTEQRLALCEATRAGLRAVFGLLGISAPERM